MEAVRRTVELGRAARAQAKVEGAPAAAPGRDRRHRRRARGDRAPAPSSSPPSSTSRSSSSSPRRRELVSYAVKPNYRALGPALRQADAAGRRGGRGARRRPRRRGDRRRRRGRDQRSTATTTRSAADDITLVMEPLEGYQVEAEAGHAVALALELDDELRREGLAREIVHAVQNARKEAGLEVTDRIELRARRRRGAARRRPRARGLRRRRDPRHVGRLRRRRRRRAQRDVDGRRAADRRHPRQAIESRLPRSAIAVHRRPSRSDHAGTWPIECERTAAEPDPRPLHASADEATCA